MFLQIISFVSVIIILLLFTILFPMASMPITPALLSQPLQLVSPTQITVIVDGNCDYAVRAYTMTQSHALLPNYSYDIQPYSAERTIFGRTEICLPYTYNNTGATAHSVPPMGFVLEFAPNSVQKTPAHITISLNHPDFRLTTTPIQSINGLNKQYDLIVGSGSHFLNESRDSMEFQPDGSAQKYYLPLIVIPKHNYLYL